MNMNVVQVLPVVQQGHPTLCRVGSTKVQTIPWHRGLRHPVLQYRIKETGTNTTTRQAVVSRYYQRKEPPPESIPERQAAQVGQEVPHHTRNVPQVPGSPARLLSDVIIGVNVVIFIAQLASPEVTLAGIKLK